MKFNRIMPGAKSIYLDECLNGNFIGVDFGINEDLSMHLSDDIKPFKERYRPVFLENRPDKSKVAAGLACGAIWTVCQGLKKGDIVLCPDGKGEYLVGDIESNYFYSKGEILPHRRRVKWHKSPIRRSDMSEALSNSSGSILTTCDLTKYEEELQILISGNKTSIISLNDSTIENASEFALERHLEDFLVKNWEHTSLGKDYNIYELDGELVGQQFPSDTGPIDILDLSKLGKNFDIIECGGVLHHMNDPSQGLKKILGVLKTHGFLKLGLYSELARQNIIEARNYIASKNLQANEDSIRVLRETVFSCETPALNLSLIHI